MNRWLLAGLLFCLAGTEASAGSWRRSIRDAFGWMRGGPARDPAQAPRPESVGFAGRDRELARALLDSDPKQSLSEEARSWRDRLDQVIAIGSERGILANGLIGYYRYLGLEWEERIPLSRENLISVIVEGRVRPATGYASGGGTLINSPIDERGNLRDAFAVQAFVATLCTTLYGPYWVLFKPEALSSDRAGGIPLELHAAYLIPEAKDREALSLMIDARVREGQTTAEKAETFRAKMLTYDEFISRNQDALERHRLEAEARRSEWSQIESRVSAHQAAIREAFDGQGYQAALDAARVVVADPSESPQVRFKVMSDLDVGRPVRFEGENPLIGLAGDILSDPGESDSMKREALNFLNRQANPRGGFGSSAALRQAITPERLLPLAEPGRDKPLRLAAIRALRRIPTDAVARTFGRLAEDPDPAVRRSAVYHGLFDHPETFRVLGRYLESEDAQDQVVALYSLTRLPAFSPEELFQAVAQLAKSPRLDVRNYAVRALRKEHRIPLPIGEGTPIDLSRDPRARADSASQLYQSLHRMMSLFAADPWTKGEGWGEVYALLCAKLIEFVRKGVIVLRPFSEAKTGDLILDLADIMSPLIVKSVTMRSDGAEADLHGYGWGTTRPLRDEAGSRKIVVARAGDPAVPGP